MRRLATSPLFGGDGDATQVELAALEAAGHVRRVDISQARQSFWRLSECSGTREESVS